MREEEEVGEEEVRGGEDEEKEEDPLLVDDFRFTQQIKGCSKAMKGTLSGSTGQAATKLRRYFDLQVAEVDADIDVDEDGGEERGAREGEGRDGRKGRDGDVDENALPVLKRGDELLGEKMEGRKALEDGDGLLKESKEGLRDEFNLEFLFELEGPPFVQ